VAGAHAPAEFSANNTRQVLPLRENLPLQPTKLFSGSHRTKIVPN
jgi:hypothetical protein